MKPVLLIPMLGKGERFINSGINIPKQLVKINNFTMIEVSMGCINLSDFNLIFIVRKNHIDDFKIDKFLIDKFGEDIKIISHDKETEGTVSTCLLAENYLDKNPLLITTLDVFFEPKININNFNKSVDGTIIVFKSDNPTYSFSKINTDGLVVETAEKNPISDLASVGLYYFKSGLDFVKYSKEMISKNIRTKNEFYICPMYNLLINDNKKIDTLMVDVCHPLGTPNEIDAYLKNN